MYQALAVCGGRDESGATHSRAHPTVIELLQVLARGESENNTYT